MVETVVDDTAAGTSARHLRILSIVEAVQESPGVIIAAQLDRAKNELMAEMKSRGVEYEERMERLAEVRPPQPEREWIYDHFDRFRLRHPWVGPNNPKPKSIVREMLTEGMTIVEYINHHGLKRSEGVLLRYLSDVYKGLIQNVPIEARTAEIDEVIDWLNVVIRTVDSSLIDEWEKLTESRRCRDRPGSCATVGRVQPDQGLCGARSEPHVEIRRTAGVLPA